MSSFYQVCNQHFDPIDQWIKALDLLTLEFGSWHLTGRSHPIEGAMLSPC
jgi:hypothetical protein